MREVINLNENDPMYKAFMDEINNATDDNLIIVARSDKNKKAEMVKPIEVKNGIYFYVAYNLPQKLVYLSKVTPEQIYKAKANTVRKAVFGSMLSLIFSNGVTLDEYNPGDEPMNVVTLDEKANGAGLLICKEFLMQIREKLGDYYILPSSIHELILVPKKYMDKDELTQIVKAVNNGVVVDDDYLADGAFELDDWV